MVSEQPGALTGSPDLLLPLAESGPYNHEGYRTFDRRPRWLLALYGDDDDDDDDGDDDGDSEEDTDDEDEEFSVLDEIGDPFKREHERYVREREARLAEIKKKHDKGQKLAEHDKEYFNHWMEVEGGGVTEIK
jgi:hypothetical protein